MRRFSVNRMPCPTVFSVHTMYGIINDKVLSLKKVKEEMQFLNLESK